MFAPERPMIDQKKATELTTKARKQVIHQNNVPSIYTPRDPGGQSES